MKNEPSFDPVIVCLVLVPKKDPESTTSPHTVNGQTFYTCHHKNFLNKILETKEGLKAFLLLHQTFQWPFFVGFRKWSPLLSQCLKITPKSLILQHCERSEQCLHSIQRSGTYVLLSQKSVTQPLDSSVKKSRNFHI